MASFLVGPVMFSPLIRWFAIERPGPPRAARSATDCRGRPGGTTVTGNTLAKRGLPANTNSVVCGAQRPDTVRRGGRAGPGKRALPQTGPRLAGGAGCARAALQRRGVCPRDAQYPRNSREFGNGTPRPHSAKQLPPRLVAPGRGGAADLEVRVDAHARLRIFTSFTFSPRMPPPHPRKEY